MATLNFPDAPDTGDIYFDSNSGFTYEWNGEVWISRGPSTIPNIKELDNISGSFNGSTTTFNLTSSSVAVTPVNAQQLVINIGNVMQNPGDDYTVSGSTITFTTAPLAGYVFQGTVLGSSITLDPVEDGSVSPASLDTSDSYNVGGITVTGITTVTDFSFSGITTVANLEPADVNVSGIGTVSNIIMTKDAAGLGATMGAAVGVVTYFGDGSNLTGLGLTFFPISYDPGISSTGQPVDTNITLDWNHPVKAGSGTITIREGSVSGTVIDQFVVGSSSSISFVNNQVILNPAASVGFDTSLFINFPAGSVKQYGDLYQNGQVTYSFDTRAIINQIWEWGEQADYGHFGINSRSNYSSPVQLPGTWSNIGTGKASLLAVNTDGELFATGQNNYGQVGDNSTVHKSSPVQIGTETNWGPVNNLRVGGNGFTNGAFKTDGTLWVWGRNDDSGSLGQNNVTNISSPTQLAAPSGNWDKFKLAEYHLMGLKDGKIYMSGRNGDGQVGQNNTNSGYSSPTQVGTDTNWANISLQSHVGDAFATKTDGTLWGWGGNYEGRGLGLNDAIARSSPTQIGTGTNWATDDGKLSGGDKCNGCIKTDGTLWTWGANSYGSCGVNVAYNPAYPGPSPSQPAGMEGFSSPVQVPGTTWANITSGGSVMWAQKTDGTQWVWGRGDNGNMGRNDRVNYSSPVQVTSDFRVTFNENGSISGFEYGGAAFKGV